MVGRRKVIASRHRRPISLPPTLGFLAGLEHLDHFAGRVDGAEHHGGLAELLDLIAKVRCNPRSFASAECGRNATRLNEAGFCPSAGSGHGRGSKSASFQYRE